MVDDDDNDDDGDAALDLQEIETELKWCKLRHERDKFIEKKKVR